jgi:hypothetical protein
VTRIARFAYAQARLQGRHGTRADERVWRRLEAIGEFANYLQVARQTVLRPWVSGLNSALGAHDIELMLRQQYRHYIDEVAHWMPGRWQEPVSWVRRLIDLPALHYLLTGASAPPWMGEDPELRRFAFDTPAARVHALQSSECAALLKGWQQGEPLYTAWLERWRALWPGPPGLTVGLESLARLLLRHIGALNLYSATASAALHESLMRALNVAFRRYSFQPAAAFAHLGLIALDLHRLRAHLLQRALFAGLAKPPA